MFNVDGFTMGAAVAVGANMRDQDHALQAWMDACTDRDQTIAQLEGRQRELENEILKLVSQAQADTATIAALNAYIKTVQQMSPNCEALKPTGEKYGNGANVTVADLEYRKAFDATALVQGRPDLVEMRQAKAKSA
ncbi:hypothetical protein ACVIGB_000658 [Bradyrhizobium sp. USDA 4341]